MTDMREQFKSVIQCPLKLNGVLSNVHVPLFKLSFYLPKDNNATGM